MNADRLGGLDSGLIHSGGTRDVPSDSEMPERPSRVAAIREVQRYPLRQAWLASAVSAIALVTTGGLGCSLSGCTPDSALPRDLRAVPKASYAPLDGLATGSKEAQEHQRGAVTTLGLPLEVRTHRTKIVLRLVPAGTFTMGSPPEERYRDDDESQHEVKLTKPFYCGKFELTRRQWEKLMGPKREPRLPANVVASSWNLDKDSPIVDVTWEECHAFLEKEKLCQLEGVSHGTYRFLTEAEWEYTCRAGTTGRFYHGDDSSDLDDYAWYGDNSDVKPHSVGQKLPNAFGLYDMHGNVREWCQDQYGEYPHGTVTDPHGPSAGTGPVSRGGDWSSQAEGCRSARRLKTGQRSRYGHVGLRLARTIPDASSKGS